jgi:predicted regulator of Ras-like GTPase activity (Roadblock/LC7/MglB family)
MGAFTFIGSDVMPEAAFTQETIEKLKAAMFRLRESGVEASAVISRDGTMIAADTAPGEEHKVFAAMYAAMLGAAETATSELKLGVPRRVILEIGKRKIIAMGTGPIAMGVSVLGPKAQYATALSEIEKAAAEVKAILAAAR